MVGVISSPRTTATATNNSEDETEWPRVDVRNLIIDLDADIKADTMMTSREKVESCPAPALPPHSPLRMTNGSSLSNSAYDSADCDKSLKMKIKRTKSGRQEIVKAEGGDQLQSTGSSDSDNSSSSSPSPSPTPPPSSQALSPSEINGGPVSPLSPTSPTSNSKRLKVDVGTSTDASTLTEPENLGACEPGTSVNLEGIVWHETDTGVLVVNITWRGKTYVGTLLDCTRHTNQWSAPRFTDSPEPGSKGRAKRNRTSMTPSDLEPRKNLRSSKAKGKGKGGKGEEFNFPAPSSPAKDSGKRKGRPDDSDDGKKRKRTGSESEGDGSGEAESEEQGEESLVSTPVPSRREPKPEQFSYKMLSCPRRECSKQYKHEEGLRWHLSHSHPEFIDTNGEIRDAATVEREEQERRRKARLVKEEKRKEGKSELGEKPPTKVAKLDTERPRENSPKPSGVKTPVRPSNGTSPAIPVSAKPPPPSGQPGQPSPRQPGQLPAGLIAPTLKSAHKPGGGEAEDLQKKIPDPIAVNSSLETEKPPANSPAYSDISDDGEDSRGRDLKLPATPVTQPLKTSIPSANLTSFSSLGLDAGPRSSSVPPHSSPAPPIVSPAARDSRSNSIYSHSSHSSHSVGPSPGTPEYHKYLAANGFPPFPYPYPVGMDPNYHVQLLKTDPIYKAKWEKDRAERERAFKEELDKDQGRYSGLSLLKDDKTPTSSGSSLPSTPVRRPESRNKLPEDLRKREREESGDRSKTAPSPMSTISVKAEFRERDDVKKEVKMEEGVKPTMETRGPPPGPQTFGYMHPSLVRPPYSMPSLGGLPPPFDPILSSSLAPFGLPGGPNPYLSSIRPPAGFTFPGDPLRSPFPSLPGAEELARGLPAPPGLSGTKALDLLQQHASQYYANQKLAELQERALKSPSSSLSSANSLGRAVSPAVSKAITTMAGKESPTPTTASSVIGDKSKSPPPLRHVHTHTHTHIGLGYPLLPPVPPPGLPPGALPPPAVGVVPASFTGSYPGKSP